jgi:hypothetical protein
VRRILHRIADDLAIRTGGILKTPIVLRGGRDWVDDAADWLVYEVSVYLAKHAEFQRRYGG